MEVKLTKAIAAAVTTQKDQRVDGLPIFYAQSDEEMVRMATVLSRILEAVAHDMGNGVYIIVKH